MWLRHRGHQGGSGGSVSFCSWEKWEKQGAVTGGTGAVQGGGYCSDGSPGIRLCPPSPASTRNPQSSPNSRASRGHSWPAGGDKPCAVHQSHPELALEEPTAPCSRLPPWPCVVAIFLGVSSEGVWCLFLKMPPDATWSAPCSPYSFTVKSPCSRGHLEGRDRRVRGWKRLHSISSQHSHHQECKLLLPADLRAFRMN